MHIDISPTKCTRITARFAACLTLIPTMVAADLADFIGNWRTHGLETPARLRERFYNQKTQQFRTGVNAQDSAGRDEFVVDVFFPDPFAHVKQTFNMSPNGNLTGGVDARFRDFRSNRFTYQTGKEIYTVFGNITGDILKRCDAIPDMYNLYLALKTPGDLVVADLAGTWSIVSYTTPDDILVQKNGGRVTDTFFLGGFRTLSATITIDSNGQIDGDFPGTADVLGPGAVRFDIGDTNYDFSINASKNTMIGGFSRDNETEYLVLVKRPASILTSELSGNWRFTALEVPKSFRKMYRNVNNNNIRHSGMSGVVGANEEWIDIYHIGEFKNLRLDIHVGDDGSFSQLGGGSLTAGLDNKATMFVDNKTIPLNPNADKTMLTGLIQDANSQILVIGIRVQGEIASTFDEAVELDLTPADVGEPLIISWKGASYLKLQAYDNDQGIWEDVDFTDGLDSMAVDPEEFGTSRLFRIVEIEDVND